MAKLKNLEVSVCSEHDQKARKQYSFPVKVDSKGMFYVTVPEEIRESVRSFENNDKNFGTDRAGKETFFTGSSLPEIEKCLHEWAKAQLDAKVTERELIFYEIDCACSHHRRRDNSIKRGGLDGGTSIHDFDGCKGAFSYNSEDHNRFGAKSYMVRVQIGFYIEKRVELNDGTVTYSYKKIDPETCQGTKRKLACWGQQLGIRAGWQGEQAKERFVEYTEQRAAFFDDMLCAMCEFQERLRNFFESGDLALKIDTSGKNLLESN